MKKSFVLYNDQYEAVEDLTDEQKGQLLDAMFLYSRGEKLKDFDPIVKMAFKFFKIVFDRDRKKWKAVADRNKKNGKKGGRPKSNKNNSIGKNPEEPKKPSGLSGNPEEPKKPVSVSVSVSGSVSDSVTLVEEKEKKQTDLEKHLSKKIKENNLENSSNVLNEFFHYRKTIKKPLKSKQGVTGFVNIAKTMKDNKLDIEKCFDYTMEKEWQSPPLDYFEKNPDNFKKERKVIDLCMDKKLYENSDYQAGGLWETLDVTYINFKPDFISDEEREQVDINNAEFIEKYCRSEY